MGLVRMNEEVETVFWHFVMSLTVVNQSGVVVYYQLYRAEDSWLRESRKIGAIHRLEPGERSVDTAPSVLREARIESLFPMTYRELIFKPAISVALDLEDLCTPGSVCRKLPMNTVNGASAPSSSVNISSVAQ